MSEEIREGIVYAQGDLTLRDYIGFVACVAFWVAVAAVPFLVVGALIYGYAWLTLAVAR